MHDVRDQRGPLTDAEKDSIERMSPLECLDRIDEFSRCLRDRMTTTSMFPGGRLLNVGYDATFVAALADKIARTCIGPNGW